MLAAAQYFTYREENRVFEDVAVWQASQATITGDGEPDRVEALQVTDGFLPILRVNADARPAVHPRRRRAGRPRRAR